MTPILDSVLPLFALVLVGYGAVRFGILSEAGVRGLNGFVYYFALPVFLFFTMARAPLAELFDWRIVAAATGASCTVFFSALGLAWLLFPERRLAERTVVAAASGFGNVAYLGIPLMLGTFGAEAAAPTGLVVLADNLVLISLIMVFLELGTAPSVSPLRLAGRVLLGFGRNPFMLAMLLGAAVGLLAPPLPKPLDNFGTLLGSAAAPCALFALGGSLHGRPIAEGRSEVGFAMAMKLFVHPAIALLLAVYVFELTPFIALIVVAVAGMPTGTNIFVLASQYGVAIARASTTVLATTALAVLTVSALLVWLSN